MRIFFTQTIVDKDVDENGTMVALDKPIYRYDAYYISTDRSHEKYLPYDAGNDLLKYLTERFDSAELKIQWLTTFRGFSLTVVITDEAVNASWIVNFCDGIEI
jgi:hypothetical protein